MKKFVLVVGVCTLAACQQAEAPAEETVETEAIEEPVAVAMAPDGKPLEGVYEATAADGTISTTTIGADGSYTRTVDGEVTSTGTMMMKSPMESCFDDANDEEGPACSTHSIAEDGTWTATNAEGETITIVRKEG